MCWTRSMVYLLCTFTLTFLIMIDHAGNFEDKFKNCLRNDNVNCTICKEGYCGRFCDHSCIGRCMTDCDIDTCNCRNCADGFHGGNCSLNCSSTCGSQGKQPTCKRYTGACNDGCDIGYCLPDKGCNKTCEHCLQGICYYDDCKCTKGCVEGYWGDQCQKACQEGCTQCNQTTGECNKVIQFTEPHSPPNPTPLHPQFLPLWLVSLLSFLCGVIGSPCACWLWNHCRPQCLRNKYSPCNSQPLKKDCVKVAVAVICLVVSGILYCILFGFSVRSM